MLFQLELTKLLISELVNTFMLLSNTYIHMHLADAFIRIGEVEQKQQANYINNIQSKAFSEINCKFVVF